MPLRQPSVHTSVFFSSQVIKCVTKFENNQSHPDHRRTKKSGSLHGQEARRVPCWGWRRKATPSPWLLLPVWVPRPHSRCPKIKKTALFQVPLSLSCPEHCVHFAVCREQRQTMKPPSLLTHSQADFLRSISSLSREQRKV